MAANCHGVVFLSLNVQLKRRELHVYPSAYALLVGSCCMFMHCKEALIIVPEKRTWQLSNT